LEAGFGLLEAASGWDRAAVTLSQHPAWVWASAFAGAFLLLAPRGLPGTWLGFLFLLPLALVRPPAPSPGDDPVLLRMPPGFVVAKRVGGGHSLP